MRNHLHRALVALAILSLTACGSGSNAVPAANVIPAPSAPPASTPIIVGVGDSLTAGYQSGGLLGDLTATSSLSAYPGGVVPPGQESGFFALLYQMATGVSATSAGVLPLIKAPGLGAQIVLNATTLIAATHLSCDAFNQAAYSASAWRSVRLDPASLVTDLGVPGMTMHEALAMHAPLTGPQSPNAAGTACNPYATIPGDPTSGGLQSLVTGESGMFYPVLGEYQATLGGNLTDVSAAVALKPAIATVWLGANDLLKCIFAGGASPCSNSPISDSPAQMTTDLTQIVTQLKATGAKIVVGNLPNVLSTPQFFPQTKYVSDLTTMFVVNGVPAGAAGAYANGVAAALAASPDALSTGSYLTESGFLSVVSQAAALIQANPANPNFAAIVLDSSGAGSGQGSIYLTAAFAAQTQGLNDAYNAAINGVAASSGVALADITSTFNTVASAGYTVAPGEVMTLQFGGGLLGWDGLHPSNVGYAVIANVFIGALDTTYALTIPQVPAALIADIANGGSFGGATIPADPYNPYALKAGNSLSPFPLP